MTVKEKLKGKFIVLDGPDGCGKSTQCKLLAEWLSEKSIEVETYRDPGTTRVGEEIRQILLNPDNTAITTAVEVMLYMAARAQLLAEKILPALKNNKCVILDRWLSSTCAYQGFAGSFGMDRIIAIANNSLELTWPDLTIILDVNLETAAPRLNATLDRMEQKGTEYHNKVRQGFFELAKNRKDVIVVDAADDIESVHRQVIEHVEKVFL